jgi:MFS superfamily sulfate permease-like transporter
VFFGTSQHVSFGTNAVIAIFTAELVESQLQNSQTGKNDVYNPYAGVNDANIPNASP